MTFLTDFLMDGRTKIAVGTMAGGFFLTVIQSILITIGLPEFGAYVCTIGRKPDAILVVATDKTQLIAPLKQVVDAGIPVITLDCAIGDGHYQTGSGDADFPLSYIASDNVAGGEIAASASMSYRFGSSLRWESSSSSRS